MQASRELTQAVQMKIAQWNREAAVNFCRLARRNAVFTNIEYPTGLRTVRAEAGAEKAEVALRVAKQLRADGYTVRA